MALSRVKALAPLLVTAPGRPGKPGESEVLATEPRMVEPSRPVLEAPAPGEVFKSRTKGAPSLPGYISSPPTPPGPTLTKPPNEQNNNEGADSPPSEIIPPSRDAPPNAPAVRTTVDLAESRRAAARSNCEVARPSPVAAGGAAGAGVPKR